jgi:hypothetical protein
MSNYKDLSDLRNRVVRFRVCDVYTPDPQEVLNEVYGKNISQGEVVD